MAASSGDAHPYPIYNARFRVVFPILDADGDLVTGAAGLDSELSQDQGTFADATNEATEIATSSGVYYLDLIATEMDTQCTAIIVKTTTTGAKTTPIVLYPERLAIIRTGTAQAGAASTITLDSGASATDDFYNGCWVNITNNSPANALGQARKITDYVGSTKVATIEGTWGTNPSSASTFEILLSKEATSATAFAGTPISDPTTAGVPEVDLILWRGTQPNNLISSRVDANTQAMASAVIAAATFAAGAVDAAALAADAGTEIAAAVWDRLESNITTASSIGVKLKNTLPSRVTKNTALSNFEFLMLDSTDHVTGKTGLTITSERSIDGGAFASTTNSAAEVANGIYKINLSAADLNGDVITLKFTSAGADGRFVTIVTQTAAA